MTQRRMLTCLIIAVVVLAMPHLVRGDVRRERTLRRPYVVEIGEPSSINESTLNAEAARISELGEYLHDYGEPDYVETQEVTPEWPWESYEVRLYYLRRNIETDFGRVVAAESAPNLGLMKFQGGIPAQKRHEIEVVLQSRHPAPPPVAEASAAPAAQPSSSGRLEAMVARIEAAAERAAQAADMAAEHSQAAERAANRTVSVVDQMAEHPRRKNR